MSFLEALVGGVKGGFDGILELRQGYGCFSRICELENIVSLLSCRTSSVRGAGL